MFSFPLFERLRAETPEFEQVAAFQAGGSRVSRRREGVDWVAVGAGRLIAAQLYGVSFWDPFALSVAAGSLTVCALIAALIPAGRAASISPMRALRTD